MTLNIGSAFFERLQADTIIGLIELVDLQTPNGSFHWTTYNESVLAPYSGTNILYDPFPGDTSPAGARNTEMRAASARFSVANTGDVLKNIVLGQEMKRSSVRVRRIWVDTPGLGEWHMFEGAMQDIKHDRDVISGTVRDKMSFVKRQWPPFVYQDTCVWQFGSEGCGVDVSSFTDAVSPAQLVVGSSSRISLFVGSYAVARDDDFYALGRATCTFGANSGSIRQIRVHTGSVVAFTHPLPVVPGASDVWTLQAGCRKRLLNDCSSKFSNVNSGQDFGFNGHKWIPLQDNAY